jgi:hypothetical protein
MRALKRPSSLPKCLQSYEVLDVVDEAFSPTKAADSSRLWRSQRERTMWQVCMWGGGRGGARRRSATAAAFFPPRTMEAIAKEEEVCALQSLHYIFT